MNYAFNDFAFNDAPFNDQSIAEGPAPEHYILFNQTGIMINWTGDEYAINYQLQVSLYADFRTTFLDTVVTDSQYSFTDSQVDNAKRFWRVRPSNGSIYYRPWSEVGNYWLDTSASVQVELDHNQWALVDIDDTTDKYIFDLFPLYAIVPQNLLRAQARNRLGELLSEYLTTKATIQLQFNGNQYMEFPQMNEFRRFHTSKRTFYLCGFFDGERISPMPHIWKVEYIEDPMLTMFSAGRPDLLMGTLNFQEV